MNQLEKKVLYPFLALGCVGIFLIGWNIGKICWPLKNAQTNQTNPVTQINPGMIHWITYDVPEFHFSFDYPEDLQAVPMSAKDLKIYKNAVHNENLLDVIYLQMPDGGYGVYGIDVEKTSAKDVDEWLAAANASRKQGEQYTFVRRYTNSAVFDRPEVVDSSPDTGGQLYGNTPVAIFIYNGLLYTVTGRSHDPDFDHFVNSMKILP